MGDRASWNTVFYGFRAVDDVLRFRLLSPHLFCWEVEAGPEPSISSLGHPRFPANAIHGGFPKLGVPFWGPPVLGKYYITWETLLKVTRCLWSWMVVPELTEHGVFPSPPSLACSTATVTIKAGFRVKQYG